MDPNTKKKIKNAAKTGGRWTMNAMKVAGKTAFTATNMAGKAVSKTAGTLAHNKAARGLVTGLGTIAATVAFAPAALTLGTLNYLMQNCILDRDYSPIDAAKDMLGLTNDVLDGVLDIVAEPVELLGKGVSQASKAARDALDR